MKYLIVGYGVTGKSVEHYCQRENIEYAITDENKFNDIIGVDCYFGKIKVPNDITKIIISPGISRKQPVIKDAIMRGVSVIGDVELFLQTCKKPIIAVTGTNGKSTVCKMLEHVANKLNLKFMLGGNIGTPILSQAILPANGYILELSSYQLESCNLHDHTACILNITPDHLDRYDDFAEYAATKHNIYKNAKNIIYNIDDKNTYPTSSKTLATSFGYKNGDWHIDIGPSIKLMYKNKVVASDKDFNVMGIHNYLNILAVCAILSSIGIALPGIVQSLQSYQPLPHRCEILNLHGITFVNDSKATNPSATLTAVKGFAPITKGKIVLILGGVDKDLDFNEIKPYVVPLVDNIILYGKCQNKLKEVFFDSTVCMAHDMREVIKLCGEIVSSGDLVLFSPGCASFDLYKNYMERGDDFLNKVKEYQWSSSIEYY